MDKLKSHTVDYRERHAVGCGIAGSSGNAPSPRGTASSRSATKRLSSSLPATSGCGLGPSYGGIRIPRLRQIAAAEDADEVVLAHDVVLLAVGAPPEHHRVGEAGRAPKFCVVQSMSDCRPGGDVRTVSGGLVADLAHGPPVCLAHEADLASTQNHVPAGAGHVLASPRRQPKHTVRADHEGERFGQLCCRSPSDPAVEVLVPTDRGPGRPCSRSAAMRTKRGVWYFVSRVVSA